MSAKKEKPAFSTSILFYDAVSKVDKELQQLLFVTQKEIYLATFVGEGEVVDFCLTGKTVDCGDFEEPFRAKNTATADVQLETVLYHFCDLIGRTHSLTDSPLAFYGISDGPFFAKLAETRYFHYRGF